MKASLLAPQARDATKTAATERECRGLGLRKLQDCGWAVCILGGRQNYGPLLGPPNTRCRIILGTPKGTIILTTTHVYIYVCTYVHICTCIYIYAYMCVCLFIYSRAGIVMAKISLHLRSLTVVFASDFSLTVIPTFTLAFVFLFSMYFYF